MNYIRQLPQVRTRSKRFLQAFLHKPRQPRLAAPKPLELRRIRRNFSTQQRAQVILLRYGSLHDFRRPRMRWCDMARTTGIKVSTLIEMVVAFHQRGNRLETVKQVHQPRALPPEVEQYLQDSLHDLRFFSLRLRSQLI